MLFPVALAALVVAVIVAVAGSVVSQRIAEQEAVHDVAELTDDLADSVVQPALTDTMPHDPAGTRRVLVPLVRHWLRNGSMVREKQVLRLAARGLANKQIALRLGISESTVKVHIGSIFRRIGVRDRTSAALWARENLTGPGAS